MADRYFEREEVETLIPELARVMERVMRASEEATEITTRLEGERERIGQAGGGMIDRAAWQRDTARVTECAERVKAGVLDVNAMGGVIKDLALGLVDFPHRRDGRVVNLCWKYGETAIGHWHGLDEGYANRKPL
ncbi:MAG TPA: DUF2203 domain-containing protein [Methylomirabilota bacterium]|jgi:hypothetical protein|nr:DUF2203 domain-containing protein [Methylomirabilota bacterium]